MPTTTNRTPVTTYLTDEQAERLRRHAAQRQQTIAEVVRQAILAATEPSK